MSTRLQGIALTFGQVVHVLRILRGIEHPHARLARDVIAERVLGGEAA